MVLRRGLLCCLLLGLASYAGAGQGGADYREEALALSMQIVRTGKRNWPFPGEYGVKTGNVTLTRYYESKSWPKAPLFDAQHRLAGPQEFHSIKITIKLPDGELYYEDYENTQAPETKLGELDSFSQISRKKQGFVKNVKRGGPGYKEAQKEYEKLIRKYLNTLLQLPTSKK